VIGKHTMYDVIDYGANVVGRPLSLLFCKKFIGKH